MVTPLVRRGLDLYKKMDTDTRVIYRRVINVSAGATLLDIEIALGEYERMTNNIHKLLNDMEDDIS